MQAQTILYSTSFSGFIRKFNAKSGFRKACMYPSLHLSGRLVKFSFTRVAVPPINKLGLLDHLEAGSRFQTVIEGVAEGSCGELSDEDDDVCPVECVREFKTDEEFSRILEKAKETNSLVVVDFYRTSCGSCKYIEQGFSKLCKGAGDQQDSVIFLKHNVIDEYDEQSEVAERLRIKAVPLFHFYRNGVLLEAFATRDKERIDGAILKYTSKTPDALR